MSDIKRADAFLRQANADQAASLASGIPEFVARYLLQQACEKALKAFGYAKYTGRPGDGAQIDAYFFNRHDPIAKISSAEVLPNGVHLLRRELARFLAEFPERVALERIDATTPSTNMNAVSYRYPFMVDGAWTTPEEFTGWTPYQGGLGQVRTATKKLLARVHDEVSLVKRR